MGVCVYDFTNVTKAAYLQLCQQFRRGDVIRCVVTSCHPQLRAPPHSTKSTPEPPAPHQEFRELHLRSPDGPGGWAWVAPLGGALPCGLKAGQLMARASPRCPAERCPELPCTRGTADAGGWPGPGGQTIPTPFRWRPDSPRVPQGSP